MGVPNFITFDAHDPRVQNATPLCGFDNFTPPYQFMRALLDNVPDLIIDKDHMMVISPDEGALDRTTYFANVLGVNIGMFYKRRDYSVIVNGKNPIVAHEFLGDNEEFYNQQQRFLLYRFHVKDPVYFSKGFKMTMDNLGWTGPRYDDYTSVAFWYQQKPGKLPFELPTDAEMVMK